MKRLESKRIKRSSRGRSLWRGVELLEVRNLLAGDVMQEDVDRLPEKDPNYDEVPVEVSTYMEDVEPIAMAFGVMEDGDLQEDEPKLEKEVTDDEQPELRLGLDSEESLEPWSEELKMTFRTLEMTGDTTDGEQPLVESFCFMSMPSGSEVGDTVEPEVVDGELFEIEVFEIEVTDGEVTDGEVLDGYAFDGEVFDCGTIDTDEFLYMMSFSTGVVTDEEAVLEDVPEDDAIKLELDDANDGGEIRYFGSDGSENPDIFATGVVTFMSDWYNPENPLDANLDGATTALDALIVLNMLERLGSVQLSQALFAIGGEGAADVDASFLVDASNDGHLSPLDGLMRLNYLNEVATTDEPADTTADDALGQSASILPGEWDQYESADQADVDDSPLSEDSGDDPSTVVFGARIRNPSIEWPDDEVTDEEAKDEFWSDFQDDSSDTLLDEGLLDSIAQK